eukprot:g15983.t1
MATTPRKPPASHNKTPVRGNGGRQGHQGKDALFSFDQQNLEIFSLPKGGAAGGGVAGLRGLAGSRKARPPKMPAEPAAPNGTEGATGTGTGTGTVAASLSKILSSPPVRAPVPESPGKPNGINNDGAGDHFAGEGDDVDAVGRGENEGVGGGTSSLAGQPPAQPAFVVSGIAAVIRDALVHPGGKASGESAAFLRVLAEMSADATAAPGPAADHDGGGEGSGVDGSGVAGGTGDQGGGGMAAIDDAEAFHLKTGDDAINFFAQYGANSPIKFVHLVRTNKGHDFPPYDLVVVNPRECSGDYYLMSSAGLVHVCHGEPSEFTPLSEWMRQSTMFNMLQSIRFFKCYLHSKCFKLWRDNVRYKLFCQQRRKLSHRLFLAKESFAGPYVELRRHMIDMQDIALLDLDAMKTFERAQFIEHQNVRRVEAAKALESSMEKVGAVVQRVCAHVTGLPKAAEVAESPLDKMFGGAGDKGKSLVALKEEAAERRRMLQRASQEAGMLGDFIRLTDYVAVEALVNLTVRTNEMFLTELLKPRKAGLFETTVLFTEQGTAFAPTCDEIKDMVSAITEAMISTVNGVGRILYLRPFNEHVGTSVTDGPNIQDIVRGSRAFRTTSAEISGKVEADFSEAEEYVVTFDSVRPIFEYNRTWDFKAYKAQQHSVTTLREQMQRIGIWVNELEKMRARQPCGILEVESRKLKQMLIPMTEEKMDQMKTLVKDLARSKCKEQLEKYKSRLAIVAQKPAHLKDFAGYVEQLETLKSQEKTITRNAQVVEQMYALLAQYDVKAPSEDMVQVDDLRTIKAQYQESMESARDEKEKRMPDMVRDLDTNIARLNDQLVQLGPSLEEGVFVDAACFGNPGLVLTELERVKQRLAAVDTLAKQYSAYQALFGITVYSYKNLTKAQEKYDQMDGLWQTISRWNEKSDSWMNEPFTSIDAEGVNTEVQVFVKDAFSAHKKMSSEVTTRLKEATQDFKAQLPIMLELGNPAMRPRHWQKLFKAMNQPYYPDLVFSLSELLDHGVAQHAELIGELSAAASGEEQLKESLAWEETAFTTLNHREQPGVFILGGLEEILMVLEDNQVTLQTMMGSRFIMGVKDEVEAWEKRLGLLSETLDEWVAVQRNWMYLETIFCAEDIQKQLPDEAAKFQAVDKMWKSVMSATDKDPLVLSCVGEGKSYLADFQLANQLLEEIQKSLEEYLETKRMAFPRFFFLSNDELLEILSQTRDPRAVQPHMSKCFDAIKSIRFGDGTAEHDIFGFKDPGGEYVAFTRGEVTAEGPVESWLVKVEQAMRDALYDNAKRAVNEYPKGREDSIRRDKWLWDYPAQVVIVVDEIMWTGNLGSSILRVQQAGTNALPDAAVFGTEAAKSVLLEKMPEEGDVAIAGPPEAAVQTFLDFSLEQIEAMIDLVRGDLDRQQRTLMGALITIDVHARDVVRYMVKTKVCSVSDFEWTKQLRYYWEEAADDVVARQTNTRFLYGYEYLGNGPRLVITPLTDICYMTLTGALHMRLGGAPAGPAGTGKTETTKDLAKALAVYCVVFNCSDGLDYKIMGRFFSGLAQQGAWACFDEFNRIDIEVLSVIAQQVLSIQQAIVQDVKTFEFDGNMIPLNKGFGVFITMNPGYAGRTELPDNLKALFRPVAMMVPDYRLIAEIVLFSEGFTNALPLSNKMAQLYSLSSEQLSKQDHYDFGMRAVKSVLVAAGQLKRKEPGSNEDLLLIRAMRDSNVPKFLEHDLPLFHGIVCDLFPGVTVPYVDYGVLQEAIETILEEEQLQKVPSFISKIIQVHETQLVRHGMMVVGEAGSGKSANVTVLAKALTRLHADGVEDRDGFYKQVDRLHLNPKSITAGELYGEFNLLTSEWTDGLVPKMVRQCVQAGTEGSDNRKWIIFDGPVDAVWIENMNTVLDDNKTLCLANSERIKLPTTLHMMFEVQDLRVASPATVSRCGMVYMEQIHVGILSLVRSWAARDLPALLSDTVSWELVELIERYLEAGIAFVGEECKETVPSNPHNLAQSLLNLLGCMLNPSQGFDPTHPNIGTLLRLVFAWAFVWSVGANVDDTTRPKLEKWVGENFRSLVGSGSPFLKDVYGMAVDLKTAEFIPWTTLIERFVFDKNVPYFNIMVPTSDTTRYDYLLGRLTRGGHNVLYMGDTGVGKSVVMEKYLENASNTDEFVAYTMKYSAQTKPTNLKDMFETKLEKKRKTLFGPPSGKKMLFFIDDLNMPALEVYGAQPPNELLRQAIDSGGFYDTQKLFFKGIKDVVFLAACAPPGGGRNQVSPRLLRHFSMVWLTALSTGSLNRIFQAILGGFLQAIVPDLNDLTEPLVAASVKIYERIASELLPTPAKSHYTFNLRDLSKASLLMVKSEHADTKDKFLRLWCHEESRVFRDRLISAEDRTWFNNALQSVLMEYLDVDWRTDQFADLLFGDYLNREDKAYRPVEDRFHLGEVLLEYLEEYNVEFPSQMHLVFFADAVAHVSRICRVLRQPRGNALLVGVGGSGRQSLTRLSAFIAGYKCVSIEITRGYGSSEFHDDLKSVLMTAGAENVPTVFLFSDSQIVEESFLEDLNNVLGSGEVPNLYAADEIEKIVGLVRPLAKSAGKLETRDAILQHYVQLVRENLHVCLCMSPIGAGFRNRCRMFPSLVNCCTVDWFNAWPEEALASVAKYFLSGQSGLGIEPFLGPLGAMAVGIHRAVERETARFERELGRKTYTTPTSYLELIKLYLEMLGTQRESVSMNESRYRNGLQKLEETKVMVNELQETLTEMQPQLAQAAIDTESLIKKVTADQLAADEQQAIVEKDVEEANKVAANVQVIKDDCQKDLDEAMPAYYASIKALDSLDKKSIQEMKSFTNPPQMVAYTMESVCILFGVKSNWKESKNLMSKMTFMDELKGFDKDNIPPKVIRSLKSYIDNPSFQPEEVAKVSSAAKSLCMWARAMYTYDKVAKNIGPKKEALAQAEGELAIVQSELGKKQEALRKILADVAELKATLASTEQKKAELEGQALKTTDQLKRAEQLIGGLGDERERWQESADRLAKNLKNLVGNVMLASGCLAYLGPFTSQFRKDMASGWVKLCKERAIPVADDFSLERVLAEPVTVRQWQLMGLPADEFSTENGMLTTMGRRWPLMIDPQGQANRWIRSMYADANLQVIKLTEKAFLRTLENGIRYGAPVLLENVKEELDPGLEPVLLKQVFKRGGQLLLRLGDTDVPYSDEFRFFVTTKLANPHYMPEICIKVTIINFTVTMTGLEDQLLVDVVKNERPDLEAKKDELVVNIANDQRTLKEIENKILYMLANASGNILDDEDLIDALSQSKVTSKAINERLTEAEHTTKEINDTREDYRVVATRGSIIYFVIAGLSNVDPMYQYSLKFYKDLFSQRLQRAEKNDDVPERLKILIDDVSLNMFTNICRGLFEKDKMIYAFMIAVGILRQAGKVSDQEWRTLLVGAVVMEASGNDDAAGASARPKPSTLPWMSTKAWDQLLAYEATLGAAFTGLPAALESAPADWKAKFFDSEAPHLEEPPGEWGGEGGRLTEFQKLLLLRAIREEKTVFAMRVFVQKNLGAAFAESPPFDLQAAYGDSVCVTPLIFILSAGADVNDYLLGLGAQQGKTPTNGGLKILSLGQGQGPIAERLMVSGRENGDWVCLQNCHLAVSWLPTLEQILEKANAVPEDTHADFRLWLTSSPSPRFPVAVLQNGIKITNEPPKGLRANLMRAFNDLKEEEYESCSAARAFKKLCFSLVFFNALILERRKFGAVRMYVEEQDDVPWDTLNVIVADVTYGGRVTDVWDKRTIASIMRLYFDPGLLDDSYRFSESGTYYAPREGSLEELKEYTRSLPVEDPPETFGLHPNADITFQQNFTNNALGTVIALSGGGGGEGGDAGDTDAQVAEGAKIIASRMPEPFDVRKGHEETFKKVDGAMNSLGVFLGQEAVRFNGLVAVMRATLSELQKAIRGIVVMSGPLEEMYNCFLFQRVPPSWEKAGYPCLKPLASWTEDFFGRIAFIGDWLTKGPRPSYWLSGFFFPQGFMTGVKQTYSRDYKIAIDTLTIGCQVMPFGKDEVSEGPTDGVYIHGLFMEGARFDRKEMLMAESMPSRLFDEMPCIWLKPSKKEEDDGRAALTYNCPLYKTSLRAGTLSTTGHSTNFVAPLTIPSAKPEDHWIRRGCAMLCMLND